MENINEERLRLVVEESIHSKKDVRDVIRLYYEEDKTGRWTSRLKAASARLLFSIEELTHSTKNIFVELYRHFRQK